MTCFYRHMSLYEILREIQLELIFRAYEIE